MTSLLTEKEAREQTCPLIRVLANEKDVISQRVPGIYRHQKCQASDCRIGWRTEHDADFAEVGEDPPRGYCGAFGAPRP